MALVRVFRLPPISKYIVVLGQATSFNHEHSPVWKVPDFLLDVLLTRPMFMAPANTDVRYPPARVHGKGAPGVATTAAVHIATMFLIDSSVF